MRKAGFNRLEVWISLRGFPALAYLRLEKLLGIAEPGWEHRTGISYSRERCF